MGPKETAQHSNNPVFNIDNYQPKVWYDEDGIEHKTPVNLGRGLGVSTANKLLLSRFQSRKWWKGRWGLIGDGDDTSGMSCNEFARIWLTEWIKEEDDIVEWAIVNGFLSVEVFCYYNNNNNNDFSHIPYETKNEYKTQF